MKSSIASIDATKYLRSNKTTHIVIIAGGRALLQDYGSGKWSAPCARWGNTAESPGWAPELSQFGRQHLKGARLHCHGALVRPGVPLRLSCNHAVVTRVEPIRPDDHAMVVDAIEGPDALYSRKLRLFTVSQLEDLDEAHWCDIGHCHHCSHGNLRDVFVSALSESLDPHSVPALRPPWECYQWIQGVWNWVATQLPNKAKEFEMTLATNWSLGFTMFVNDVNSGRRYWFKASPVSGDIRSANGDSSPSAFQRAIRYKCANEAAVAHFLSHEYPEVIPHLLASDPEKGWLLIEDAGMPFDKLSFLSQRRLVLSASETYARVQLSFADRNIQELIAHGFRDRRPRMLPEEFCNILSTRKNQAGFLRFTQSGLMNRVRHLCDVLEQGSVPNGLVHGDIYEGNAFKDMENGELRLINWSNACISNPLFDSVEAISDHHRRLRNYRRAIGLSGDEGKALLKAARPLALLHRVVAYCGYLESMEPHNQYREEYAQEAERMCSEAADLIDREQYMEKSD